MKQTLSLIVPALAILALSGCGDVREDLGLGRSAPDEFAVVDRAPLSVPPDFSLRPPQPGAARPQEIDMKQRANDIVYGGNLAAKTKNTAASGGEKGLLTAAGAENSNPDIRDVVDHEAAEKVVGSTHLVDDLLWWKKDEVPTATVDAAAESARIKAAKEKGEPLNQSATPIIERQKNGWLGL